MDMKRLPSSRPSPKPRVAIIGAGACGLTTAKCLLDEDLAPVVFEQANKPRHNISDTFSDFAWQDNDVLTSSCNQPILAVLTRPIVLVAAHAETHACFPGI